MKEPENQTNIHSCTAVYTEAPYQKTRQVYTEAAQSTEIYTEAAQST